MFKKLVQMLLPRHGCDDPIDVPLGVEAGYVVDYAEQRARCIEELGDKHITKRKDIPWGIKQP